MSDELADLKAGDEVAVLGGYGPPCIRTVQRITETQIVIPSSGDGSAWRFRRDNGREIGGSVWHRCYLAPVTPAIREQSERYRLTQRIVRHEAWDLLTIEELRVVAGVIETAKARQQIVTEPGLLSHRGR